MAFCPVVHSALYAFRAHATHTHPILQRYCEQEAYPDGDLMSQAKILEFSMWLVDEAAEWCSLLVQQRGVRGNSSAVSELRSYPAPPNFGLVHAVSIYATSRRSAGSNTHRVASPQMYLHPWRSRQSETWSVHEAGRCRLRTSMRKWQLRWVSTWSEHIVQAE